MYFMEFKVKFKKNSICYAGEVILDIDSIVIYVNLEKNLSKMNIYMTVFWNVLEVVRVCPVSDLQTRHTR